MQMLQNCIKKQLNKLWEYIYEKCTERNVVSPTEKKFRYRYMDVYSNIGNTNSANSFNVLRSIHNGEDIISKIILIFVGSYNYILNEQSWLLLVLLGFFSATTSILLHNSIIYLNSGREYLLSTFYSECTQETHICNFLYFIYSILFRVFFCIIAGVTIRYVSPQAAGSGLPEMKSILSGIILPRYLSFRTYLAKVIGLIFAICGGLSIGMEGPFVHISAIIANQLLKASIFAKIHKNQAIKFQMLSAACGVGISTVFGAPIGGILFAIEKTTSFLTQNIWKSLVASTIGSLIGKIGGVGFTLAMFATDFSLNSYQYWELIVFILIGILFGYLGSLWVKFVMLCVHLRRDYKILSNTRYIQLVIIGLLTAVLIYPLKAFQQDDNTIINNLFDTKARDIAIWETPNMLTNLLFFVIYKFFFTAVSLGLPIPCGLYIPVFMIGAALGRLIGEFMMWFSDSVVPGGYAVVGAAAMSAGVTRTFSTSIIVFEVTGQLDYFIPVLLATIISTHVGNIFSDGIYESLLEQKRLPYMPTYGKLRMAESNSTAESLMKTSINFLPLNATYNDICKLLDGSVDEVNFPVVLSQEDLHLQGAVKRSGLESLVESKDIEFSNSIGPSYQRNNNESDSSFEEDLYHQRYQYFDVSIEEDLKSLPSIEYDISPIQVLSSTNFYKIHYMFSMLGVATVYVIEEGLLKGVLTNRDFFEKTRHQVIW